MRSKRSNVAVAAGVAVVLGLGSGWAVYADYDSKHGAVPGTLYALATSVPHEVLVEVNGEALTRGEVDAAVEAMFGQELGSLPAAERAAARGQLEARILDDLIARTLLFQEAEVQKIAIDPGEIEASLARLEASLPAGATARDYAASAGWTPAALRERIEESLRVEALLEKQLAAVEAPSESELRDFYQENAEFFEVPEQVEVRHLLLAADPAATAELRESKRLEAEGIREQFVGDPNASFEATAAAHSDCPSAARGGRLGSIARGDVVAPFEQAAFGQEVGEIGPVVETEFGFHLIRVDARHPASQVPFAEASTMIAQRLDGERREAAFERFIERLEADASIVYPAQEPA